MTATTTSPEAQEEHLARLRQAAQALQDEVGASDRLAAYQEYVRHLEAEVRGLHAQLHRVHRLATLGTMSAMVAHEFNNILTPIIGYAQMAQQKPRMRKKAVARAAEAGQRANDICQAILGIARGDSPEPVRLEVAALVAETLRVMARDPKRDGIDVVFHAPEDLTVVARKVELEHVLLNLLLNARDAVLRKSPPRRIEISAEPRDGGAVIRVSDNGPGIPREIRQRIFEPFFSTRTGPDGQPEGTGLGLALCRELVRSLGGRIDVESEPGRGATFSVHVLA